jgi:nitrogen fixation/metabolism regulation signal transduction histidine kinase
MAALIPLSVILLRRFMDPVNRILSALNDGFQNFLDNDFSVSLAKTRNDELGELVAVYNKVGEILRTERLNLYQRELLLDTVIQTTPLSLVLTDNSDAIIYSNSAAKQLLNQGKAINGFAFQEILANQAGPFLRSVNSGLSGLFTVNDQEQAETYHLTQSQFLLNGRQHRLYLFKTLTKEINRQEVATWKKVIRLISHELNNSLAPITSLAHSGRTLSDRQGEEKLGSIFSTMGERARYLQSFIEGYAKFARLPKPQIQQIESYSFFSDLKQISSFELNCPKDAPSIYADPAQLQQVLINLIKNAHEASDNNSPVHVSITFLNDCFEIQVKDRGKGMSESNLSNALLPFYSTKAEGTGLGLPLCREIVEAHGGKIMITNRREGGLKVTIVLPLKS